MENTPEKINGVFENLAKILVEKQFNSKLVTDRVSRLAQFTIKADRVYFDYLKNAFHEFLDEEEKIHEEISGNLNADDSLTNEIYQEAAEVETICEDTRKLVEISRELSSGIVTIKKRIESYEKIQKVQNELQDVCGKCKELVSGISKDNIVIDED